MKETYGISVSKAWENVRQGANMTLGAHKACKSLTEQGRYKKKEHIGHKTQMRVGHKGK